MKKLDQKQVPQFVALCIVSAGVFGYFVLRIVTPSPAAAGTRAPQPVAAVVTSPTTPQPASKPAVPAATASAAPTGTAAAPTGTAAAPTEAAAAPPEDASVPAPTPGMRDPFVVGYVDPKTIPAPPAPTAAGPVQPNLPKQDKLIARLGGLSPAPVSGPPAPALPPGLSGFSSQSAGPPAPALPLAAPAWTVTGVLQNDVEKMAILRDGEARRIVRSGDFVDSTYRVISVSRVGVVLRHAKTAYSLKLGQKAVLVGGSAARASTQTASLDTAPALQQPSLGLLPVGTPAPDFQLSTPSGKTVSLSQLRGRPVLIDFWATWCQPCRKSMPNVQSLHQEFGSSLGVLSVNTHDTQDAMLTFLGANPQYTTTMLLDTPAANVATGKYRVSGIPTVYLIDKDGRIAGAYVNPSEETLRQATLALGAKPSAAPALSQTPTQANPTQAAPVPAGQLARPALALAQMGRTFLKLTLNNLDAANEAGKLLFRF